MAHGYLSAVLRRLVALIPALAATTLFASDGGPYRPMAVELASLDSLLGAHGLSWPDEKEARENERLVSSTLALTLGAFGAHRLYLGTTPKVAVFYGLTFGGFGILAIMDLAHLLFTRDLAPYRQNDKVFMWGARPQGPVTPP